MKIKINQLFAELAHLVSRSGLASLGTKCRVLPLALFRAVKPVFVCLIGLSLAGTLISCVGAKGDIRANWSKTTVLRSVNAKRIEHPAENPGLAGSKASSGRVLPLGNHLFSTHKAHEGEIPALVVSPTGREAFSGGYDGKVIRNQLLETPNGEIVQSTQLIAESEREILSLALNAKAGVLAVGQYSSVSLINLKNLKISNRMTRIRGRVSSLEWTADGSSVLIGMSSGKVYAWQLSGSNSAGKNSLKALGQYVGAQSAIVGLAAHPDGKIFFSAEKNGRIIVWRLRETETKLGLLDPGAKIDRARVSKSAKLVSSLKKDIISFFLSKDGSELFAVTGDNLLRPWKVKGLLPQAKLSLGGDGVVDLSELNISGQDLLLVATRSQRINIICPKSNGAEVESESSASAKVLASSSVFEQPLVRLYVAENGPVLWATQKTGSVLVLDIERANLPKSSC